MLFDGGDRHVTAETLRGEAVAAAIPVSLATVYNVLNRFIAAGLLRELIIAPGRSYFDTNVDDHHHFFCEPTGLLQDIAWQDVAVSRVAALPSGTEISSVEVIIRLRTQE